MMFKTYQSLDHKGRLRRSIGVAVFSFFLIILLFAFPKFPLGMNLVFSLVLIVVGTYQIQRDYKKSKKENEENWWN